MPSTDPGGPYVQIAAFCQTALTEGNGQLSIIRIIDRVIVTSAGGIVPPQPIHLTLIVIIKSGLLDGSGVIQVNGKSPSGKALPEGRFPALFEGNEKGVQVVVPVSLPATEEGLYWFGIEVNGTMQTKVPLRVIHQPPTIPFQTSVQR